MKNSKTFAIAIILMLLTTAIIAEDYGWKKEMAIGVNMTMSNHDNWSQGGEDSFSWQTIYNFKFINNQEKTNWENSGKLAYGETKSGDEDSRKSTDEIKLESVFTYKIGTTINPYAAMNFETQFRAGYEYVDNLEITISDFMDPGYFRESVGFGYKPSEMIKTRLGLSAKQTITNDYRQFADDPETDKIEKTKNEIGGESVTDLNWKINETTAFSSKLELFSTFESLDKTDFAWDNILAVKISKYFNFNYNLKMQYDKDVSKKRQIKQAFALGFSYNLI